MRVYLYIIVICIVSFLPIQRPGPGGPPGGRFPGPGGPQGQGNYPKGPGGMPPNRFPNMPPGGPMGPNRGGGDRREGPRRDDFEAKRMRRF